MRNIASLETGVSGVPSDEYYYNMRALLDACRKELKNVWELRRAKPRRFVSGGA